MPVNLNTTRSVKNGFKAIVYRKKLQINVSIEPIYLQ